MAFSIPIRFGKVRPAALAPGLAVLFACYGAADSFGPAAVAPASAA
jgi:hypothetical protein